MIRPLLLTILTAALINGLTAGEASPIPRLLPPPGKAIPEADRARLDAAIKDLRTRVAKAGTPEATADVAVLVKAVEFALRFGEFWEAKDVAKADWAIEQAGKRLEQLRAAPWASQRGLVVRGYVSSVDGAVLPYGLIIPDKLDLAKPAPLYVWLRGRNANGTDLHFIYERARSIGDCRPGDGAIVLHVFGRSCTGYKSAGEIDVLEAIAHVQASYRIDPERVALMGFSMGGAGAKHLGAHYAERWAAVSAGAGFAETRRYLNLKPEDVPPYEARLWGIYDSPDYVRNLFNIPMQCYSGEEDAQMKAAVILGEAYEAHGRKLEHLVAPKTGHKYHPDYLNQIMAFLAKAVAAGRPSAPEQVFFQTKTLRYSRQYWVEALGLGEHWTDSRIDAKADTKGVNATTSNITRLRLTWPGLKTGGTVTLNGQALKVGAVKAKDGVVFELDGTTWKQSAQTLADGLHKVPGLQGPIDDAFMGPFLIVLPSKPCSDAAVDHWVQSESTHQRERWAALMRGDPRVKKDSEVTAEDIAAYHLVLWGDAAANSLTAKVLGQLPITWDATSVTIGSGNGTKRHDGTHHVPALIYPNPLNPLKYVVLNSGLTFREAHDKTNSQQNPKLPDWAVIDISQAPSDTAPGKIAAAGFFDERWQAKASP